MTSGFPSSGRRGGSGGDDGRGSSGERGGRGGRAGGDTFRGFGDFFGVDEYRNHRGDRRQNVESRHHQQWRPRSRSPSQHASRRGVVNWKNSICFGRF